VPVLRLDDLDQGEALPAVHLAAVTRVRLRVLAASALVALALAGVSKAGGRQSPPSMKVIGYYADWTAARYPLADIPAAKLTHVNYAFAKIGTDNRLTWNASAAVEQVYPGDCSEPSCPHGLFNQITLVKRRHPHLKFLLSVGGGPTRDRFTRWPLRTRRAACSRSRAPTS
jgi:GH18 family chitinase